MAGIIAKENMRAGVQAADWREAIRQAGGVLEAAGSITSEYTYRAKENRDIWYVYKSI